MNSKTGWIFVAAVIVGAAGFYFWPMVSKAPTTTGQPTTTQTGSTDTSAMIVGTWQSNTDAKFTREFKADGVIYDRYTGDTTPGVGGSWSIVLDVSREAGLKTFATSLAGKTVIKAAWEDGAEATYFTVDTLNATSLTTTDLTGNGKVTVYTKI